MASSALTENPSKSVTRSEFRYLVTACAALLFFPLLNGIAKKTMFGEGLQDGFFVQIADISQMWMAHPQEVFKNPLYLIHTVRLGIIWPFLVSWYGHLPAIVEAAMLVPFMAPLLFTKSKGHYVWASFLVLAVPYALSFRSTIVVCGFAYWFMYFFSDNRRSWQLYMSALLAFLSSGVVLTWLIIFLIGWKRVAVSVAVRLATFFVMATGLTISIIDKLRFFDSDKTKTHSTGLFAAIQRNTIVVSYFKGETARFLVYVSMAVASLFFIYLLARSGKAPKFLFYFFLASLPGFFFEGLSVLAFVMPIAWCLFGWKFSAASSKRVELGAS